MIPIRLVLQFLFLLLLFIQYILVVVSGEVRCIEKEREALLTFKRGLIDESGVLSTWGNEDEKKECCNWHGVHCSNITGHVIRLRLRPDDSLPYGTMRGEINPALLELQHLTDLELSNINFGVRFPKFLSSMKMLQRLNLNTSSIYGAVPPQFGNLTSLKTLDLSWNSLTFENLHWLSHLSSLSNLFLNGNNISDANWPQHIMKLHSIERVSFQQCWLHDGIRPKSLFDNSSSTSLSHVNLAKNSLTMATLDWLFNIRSIREIIVSQNQLDGLIPDSIKNLTLLEVLSLRSNNIKGVFPTSMGNLTHLVSLDLAHNDLSGPLVGLMGSISCKTLEYLYLDKNQLSGSTSYFSECVKLRHLSIRVNKIKGLFKSFALLAALEILDVSHNLMEGTISEATRLKVVYLDVSANDFSGPLPLFHTDVQVLRLSKNNFSGSITSICNMDNLIVLGVEDNQLSGELPSCWEKINKLRILNLASNNFSGEIPNSLSSAQNLTILYLNNNNFIGELPSSLKNCENLKLFDVAGNKLTGNIPKWIGASYKDMKYLIFRDNRFYGNIPNEICELAEIKILDLSKNNLTGKVPRCFDNFTSLVQVDETSEDNRVISLDITIKTAYVWTTLTFVEIPSALIQWKGKESRYTKTLGLVKAIDLSNNKFIGNIPRELFYLKGLQSFNLSNNCFEGNIPLNIGLMGMLESLDLSRNHLFGPIPASLARLSFLQILDLSQNNLSGKIPTSTQLQSFNESTYMGNPLLCGPPLALCLEDGQNSFTPNFHGSNGFMGLSSMQDLGISIAFGFIFGFWGVIGLLLLKRSWRIAYFNFFDDIGDWMYLKIALFAKNFKRNLVEALKESGV